MWEVEMGLEEVFQKFHGDCQQIVVVVVVIVDWTRR
jgi:hypothetical protein